MLRYSRAR